MIIVESNGGQLCNKIWSYASILAYARHYKKKLVILDFDEYASEFPYLIKDKSIMILPYKRYGKYARRIIRILKKIGLMIDVSYPSKPKLISNIQGWESRFKLEYLDGNNIKRIKSLFTPRTVVIEKCNQIINQKRAIFTTIIGIHIRRGDYREYADGQYFYTDEEYLAFMKQMKDLVSGSVSFLICSNEFVDINKFDDLDCFQIPNSTAIEDLYGLSQCDYILGAHSTYSMWASFFGEKPLKLLMSRDENFTLNDFEVFLSKAVW